MSVKRINQRSIYITLFIVYVIMILGITLLLREPSGKEHIQTEWLIGYRNSNQKLIRDNLKNLLLFVPIGVLVGILSRKHKILLSLLFGLFVSETIECTQLIWQLGTFDVDDLFFNSLEAFVGGLLLVMVVWIKKLKKKNIPSD